MFDLKNQGERPKILVIEDDLSLVEILENIFQIANYDFQFYGEVHDIKALAYAHQPDLILIDYLLPSNNGGNLCLQLKNNPSTAHIPVIIYSAIAKKLLPILEYKCDCFIEKPFDLDFLLAQINALRLK